MKKKEITKRKKMYPFKGLFDRILGSLFESIEDNTEELLEKLGNFAFLKSTLKKQITYFMFSFIGILLFLIGIGLMIYEFFPTIKIWMIYLVLGFILYIIGLIYKNLK
jgi:uncharacterized membrane protein